LVDFPHFRILHSRRSLPTVHNNFLDFGVHHLLENHRAKSKPVFLRRFAPKTSVFVTFWLPGVQD
jgi:hypothetical protein